MRILTALMVFILLLAACREERKVDVAAGLNPEKMATMTTKNISTLISDSGVIQYKIVAPLWQVFDEADTPYWHFPKGLFLQKYDPYFQVVATVAADSAKFFQERASMASRRACGDDQGSERSVSFGTRVLGSETRAYLQRYIHTHRKRYACPRGHRIYLQ